ncbi:protein FAR-RED IMPAIRED RESPONSE 1 [Cannabis sativa]|uniref:protein FAR-RED IMPAIRED RESPONSE 1 n=1 Tax=Cannabis sativa TaxID=3483 RepID=UPI0029CA00EA|nr:protein FAR-RED IMPAIRED RESPONSE 1 [Cannabis sativa]
MEEECMDTDLEKKKSERMLNMQKENDEGNDSGVIKAPESGIHFSSFNDLYEYYREYGKQEGFGIKKKTTCASEDRKIRFLTLSCSRAGKSESHKQNFLNPNPLTRVECKARINGTILEDGKCKINSVILEHNHGLSPQKSRFYLCNREISIGAQRKLELNDRAGISVVKNFQSFMVEAGGHENVPFLEKDCRNLIEKARRLRLGVGDAEAIHKYFVQMQSKNSSFFYMMDLDDKSRIKNVFWADARSRAMYEEFGDVVTFDTTYLTNKYNMPFAPFIGVNHHGQSILLGCGLLSSETTETFIWLFKTWLACMSGCAPKAIITDQAKAMKNAIEVVFPQSRHRWCLWYIMKKIPEKLSSYQLYKPIKKAMKNCVYNSLRKEEFEVTWDFFINDFNLQDNEWLNSLYEERNRWVPAFVKDTFWAGMSTTQRSESMNTFFDGYVNSKITLKQFVEQYDSALRDKMEKENRADFQSFSTIIPCVTHFAIEKQFQAAYTNTKFKEFQKELIGKIYCGVSCLDESSGLFNVCEAVFFEGVSREVNFKIHFNKENSEV